MMAITFVIGGLFHLLKFNRHVIWAYVKRSREERSQFRWAVLGSIVVFIVVIAGTISDVQPFAAVIDVNERFRNGWVEQGDAPPAPHLEERTLAQVARGLGIEAEEACASLRQQGIACTDTEAALVEIAEASGVSPADIYRVLRPEQAQIGGQTGRHLSSQTEQGHGSGWGRMTVAEAARSRSIDPDRAIENLRRQGIEASPDQNLRELAQLSGVSPGELAQLMSTDADRLID
jgi:hypothetical protein